MRDYEHGYSKNPRNLRNPRKSEIQINRGTPYTENAPIVEVKRVSTERELRKVYASSSSVFD